VTKKHTKSFLCIIPHVSEVFLGILYIDDDDEEDGITLYQILCFHELKYYKYVCKKCFENEF
jgi:hypothetical protein